MIDDRHGFDPAELAEGADGVEPDLEVGAAYAAARALQRSLGATRDVRPSDGYADRVMAALAEEPAPARAAFAAPLRARGIRGMVVGFAASVRAAWHVATEGTLRVRPRATALAYVLAIVLVGGSVVGVAGYGLAGAFGLLGNPRATPVPSGPVIPGPTSVPAPSLEESLEPGESVEPSETEDGGGGAPGGTEQPGSIQDGGGDGSSSTDEHGGATPSPSPTQTGDHGGGPTPSSGATQTPKPSQTAEPSRTPRPSGTAQPTSGSGSGSGSEG